MTPNAKSLPPITIVHVAERYTGGVATFVKLLAETQSKDKHFAAVHVLADSRYSPYSRDAEGVTVHSYESSRNPWKILGVANSVNRILREIQPDVVVAHSSFPGFYTRIRRQAWPIIYCAHGWSFSQSASKLKAYAYGIAERFLALRTAAIVNVSAFEQRQAVGIGISEKIQHTILNGLPDRDQEAPLRFSVDSAQINLGFIGRNDSKKGMDRLWRAFQDRRLKKITLWIIGGANDGKELDPPPAANIQMVDWIPNSEMHSHIQALDAVVIPSRWEACPMVALEAMRAGRAVISSRAGGLPEIVTEGENGLFINIDELENMRSVLLSLTRDRLRELGREGRRIFEKKFTWVLCYNAWTALIGRVMAEARGKTR